MAILNFLAQTTTTTTCTNVHAFCASYSQDDEYKCPGHTNRVSGPDPKKYSGQTPPFSNFQCYQVGVDQLPPAENPRYSDANVISADNINTLRDNLDNEIQLRKKHSLYKTKDFGSLGANIIPGEEIKASQQNTVRSVLAKLADAINSVDAKAGDGKKTSPATSLNADVGDIVRVTDLKGSNRLEGLLTPILEDCICYSDCTDHKTTTKKKTVCTCVGQCGCVYY